MYTLKKCERLCSFRYIESLFESGKSFFCYPFRVIWLAVDISCEYPVQAAFSVSKRKFKRAVQRNLLKRHMRECYRHHKNNLYSKLKSKNVNLIVMFIYTANEIHENQTINEAMIKATNTLSKVV